MVFRRGDTGRPRPSSGSYREGRIHQDTFTEQKDETEKEKTGVSSVLLISITCNRSTDCVPFQIIIA